MRPKHFVIVLFYAVLGTSALLAAPALRLSSAVIGPVSVATGANGPSQTIEAFNAGDGSLSLTVTSSVPWATATVGASRACTTRSGNCLPITVALGTSSLPAGIVTGTLTVSDANALDAPQTVTFTAQVGGGVPDRVELIAPANGAARFTNFTTNSPLATRVSTQDNNRWLTVSLEGGGTFRFTYNYRVQVAQLPGMGEGTYTGSLVTANSTLPAENKTVAVTMRVTSQPIASPPARLSIRALQGGPAAVANLVLANAGLGTLTVSSASAAASAGGTWLTTGSPSGAVVPVTATPGSLAAGTYSGAVTVNSNAANAAVTVPVEFTVVPPGPPNISLGGVLYNALAEVSSVAPGGILSAYGERFNSGNPVSASSLPLGTTLGPTRVLVNGVAAPVFYSSSGQVNFQIPVDVAPGLAEIRLEREGQRGNGVSVTVEPRVPRILPIGFTGYGIVVNPDGSLPLPASLGLGGRPARAGEALVIYALGLGATSPPVASGVGAPASEPFARVNVPVSVTFGGPFSGSPVVVQPLFVGLTPGFVGLYQINVVVPDNAPTGDAIPVSIQVGGVQSNSPLIAIQ